jgi:phosphate transport system permease protein
VNAFALLFLVAGLGLIGWLTARARAAGFDRGGAKRLHSLPGQHGWYVAMWTMLPALLFVAVWSAVSPGWSRKRCSQARRGAAPQFEFERDALLAEAKRVAATPDANGLRSGRRAAGRPDARRAARYGWMGTGIAILLAFAGGAFAFTRVSRAFRARTRVERG